jgi:hypothetical protein
MLGSFGRSLKGFPLFCFVGVDDVDCLSLSSLSDPEERLMADSSAPPSAVE